ncbi:MAG: hypothetical protein RBR32_06700 [Bacteroidales bacterium]|nr:hypothetical protein [Bacteroidales bacterium]
MTCVIGMIDNGNIYMGADSAGTNGRFQQRIRVDEKVFIKDEMIFGFTSSFRMGQLLRYQLNIPEHSQKKNLMTYMNTDFIEAVRKCLKDYGYASIDKNQDYGGTFLVGYKSNLFRIESDFQVGISKYPYEACGCGEDFALGCIYGITRNQYKMENGILIKKDINLTPKQIIKIGLRASYKFSAGVKPPFKILTLKGEKE